MIMPDWPQPAGVNAYSSTRHGGISKPPYVSLNLGDHVGDHTACVVENRRRLMQQTRLPHMPLWLQQVHGTRVVRLTGALVTDRRADAIYSNVPGQVCAVMTADCLPVLFCSQDGKEVAAAHAGWRGLSAGILEATIAEFRADRAAIMAWLGPAIGVHYFVVGAEVREDFISRVPAHAAAFFPHRQFKNKYLVDIYMLARWRLQAAGISFIYGGNFCTMADEERFFSYRRDKITGRMASLIWFTTPLQ